MASRRIEVEIVGDARSLEAALGRAQTASGRLQRGLDPVARGAKRTLLGLGALAGAAAKLAIDFDRTSSQMVGLGGVGERQVESWKDAMLDLAPVVGKAPEELAKALYFVSSSGVDASKALGVLDKAARASAAGLGETEVVADAVTSAMNAYATTNLSAAEATDVLVAAVREGKGEASAIAPVLGNILPIASQLGVGFNEVGAALASMTRLGTDASTAATNISATFSAILKPSVQAEEAFKDMGTSANELRAMLDEKGLLKTLQFLEDRTKGNSAAMAKAFPNIRALRGVLQLVGKAGEDTASVFATMEDNTGSLGTAFGAVAKTDGFKLEQSFASIKAAGIRMGSDLAPVIAGMAGGLADAAGFAADHETATKAAAIAVAGFSVAIIGANTALKVYNSNLVAATVGQTRLLAAARAGPYLLLAGALIGVGLASQRLRDQSHEVEDSFNRARDAARDYKAALDDLRAGAGEVKDANLRLEQSELSLERAQRDRRKVLQDHSRDSLVYREANLRVRQALREVERAEQEAGKAQRDRTDARTRSTAGEKKAAAATEEFRSKLQALAAQQRGATGAASKGAAAFTGLLDKMDAKKAQEFADKVRVLANDFGGAQTKAGRAATAVADLTEKIGKIPSKKEIDLVVNADRAYDAIENLRARASTPVYLPVFLRPSGTTGIQARAHGGPVVAGRAYIVGERQPELFIPDVSGRVMPSVTTAARTIHAGGASPGGRVEVIIVGGNPRDISWFQKLMADYARQNGGLNPA